jgi:hypothetical protein
MRNFYVVAASITLLLAWGATTAQSPVAIFKFEDAQAAFAEQRHADALQLLADAEREFGEANPPILYLRILVRHALLTSAETLDFDNLERLRADADHYLRVFGAVDALRTQLHAQMREVYRVQQSLSEYPADRLSYAESLLDEFNADEALSVLAGAGADQRAVALRIRALHRIADRDDYHDEAIVRALESELASFSHFADGRSPVPQQLLVDLASHNEYRLGAEAYGRNDYATAHDHLQQAARAGNGRAISVLGEMYYRGLGVPQDFEQALEYLRQGVSLNDTYAVVMMGIVHYEGQAVVQDIPSARQWFERAAATGRPETSAPPTSPTSPNSPPAEARRRRPTARPR